MKAPKVSRPTLTNDSHWQDPAGSVENNNSWFYWLCLL